MEALLKDGSARCESCQKVESGPKRFCFSFGAEEVVFNKRSFLEIMFIGGDPV